MNLNKIIIVIVSLTILPSCATVIKGYYNTVELKHAPDTLRVFTIEGVEIPVTRTTVRTQVYQDTPKWVDRPVSLIELRSKYDQTLVLKCGGQEKKVQAFGEIGGGWLLLSTACGFFPAVVDALTGNWNSFDPIDASFK